MAIYSLHDELFVKDVLREQLLNFINSQGGVTAEAIDFPAPKELAAIVKDSFRLTKVPCSMHQNHFRSEIEHLYKEKGYARVREYDPTLMWFKRGNTLEAIDVSYLPNKMEARFLILERNVPTLT